MLFKINVHIKVHQDVHVVNLLLIFPGLGLNLG